eukprot:240406_1
MTNPNQIGQKEKFYKVLYNYCNDSVNKHEYETKIIILNYICAKTYVDKISISKSRDAKDYLFARWLSELNENELQYITVKQLKYMSDCITWRKMVNPFSLTNHFSSSFQTIMLQLSSIKLIQIIIRTIMIIITVSFDVFYLQIFSHGSVFMNTYNKAITFFGIFGIILFIIWLCWIVFETFILKWNAFCASMIAPKHPLFSLSTTAKDFVQQCDIIYMRIKKEHYIYKQPTAIECVQSPAESTDNSLICFICAIQICIILVIGVLLKQQHSEYCLENNQTLLTAQMTLMCVVFVLDIIVIIVQSTFYCSTRKQMRNIYAIHVVLFGILFGLYTSAILLFFYHDLNCQNGLLWILMVSLEFIGCLICSSLNIKSFTFNKITEIFHYDTLFRSVHGENEYDAIDDDILIQGYVADDNTETEIKRKRKRKRKRNQQKHDNHNGNEEGDPNITEMIKRLNEIGTKTIPKAQKRKNILDNLRKDKKNRKGKQF